MAKKNTAPKPFCFVLMPFDAKFDDVYAVGIEDACKAAGAYCERVDKQIYSEPIMERVYNQIAKADMVIADMTGGNANVFYEVGYAHALNKLTILLTEKAKDIPFDLKNHPHVVYEGRVADLRTKLTKIVKHYVENPPKSVADAKLGIDLYYENTNMAKEEITHTTKTHKSFAMAIRLHNATFDVISTTDFRIALSLPKFYDIFYEEVYKSESTIQNIKMPNEALFNKKIESMELFPDTHIMFWIKLTTPGQFNVSLPSVHPAKIIVYSKFGKTEYPFKVHLQS